VADVMANIFPTSYPSPAKDALLDLIHAQYQLDDLADENSCAEA
jgi:hypothetical protein